MLVRGALWWLRESTLCFEISVLVAWRLIFRSFLWNDLIKWVIMSVRPSVNILGFFYLLSYYWADYFETSQDDTRHGSAQSLSPWFCDSRSRDPKMKNCPLALFYLLLYYWAEYFERLPDDIRHRYTQSLNLRFFLIPCHVTHNWGQNIKIFM